MKRTIILITLLVSIISINYLTKPLALSYDDSVENIEMIDDKLIINFKDNISNFKILEYNFDNKKEVSIEAWKQTVSFNKNKQVIISDLNNIDKIYYTDFKHLDKSLYGEYFDNQITLPRLTLNYYFSFAIITTLLMLAIKYLSKTKKLDKFILLFASYIISSSTNMQSISQTTHYLIRDFSYNLVLTIPVFLLLQVIINRQYE